MDTRQVSFTPYTLTLQMHATKMCNDFYPKVTVISKPYYQICLHISENA